MGTEGLDPVTSRNGEWLTVSQAVGLLGITARTLREWSAAGAVEVHRTGGRHRRYRRADIERFRDALADGAGNDAIDERVRELSVLADVAQTIFAHIDPKETLKAICEKLMGAMGGAAVVASGYDERSGTLTTLADHSLEQRTYPVDGTYALSDYPATARVIREQVVAQARLSDPRVDPAEAALMKEYGIKTLLVLPLVRGERTIGIAEVGDHRSEQVFSRADVKLARAIAGKAASTIELGRVHEQLELQARTDGLTGLFNHRYLAERLEQEVAKAQRYGAPLSVLMIDIDDFKPFNDTYGHPQGDKLLKEVARILLNGARRKVDLVSRYGGEEFVVVLPNTPTGRAERLAERLRGSVPGDGGRGGGGTGETVGDGGRGGEGTGEAVGADGRAGVRTGEAVAEAMRLAMAEQRFEGYPERSDVQVTVSIGVACYPRRRLDGRGADRQLRQGAVRRQAVGQEPHVRVRAAARRVTCASSVRQPCYAALMIVRALRRLRP